MHISVLVWIQIVENIKSSNVQTIYLNSLFLLSKVLEAIFEAFWKYYVL